jgi:hypothetical protein
MKKFTVGIEDEDWGEILEEMKYNYGRTDPDRVPPLDEQVLKDFLYHIDEYDHLENVDLRITQEVEVGV